MAEQITRAFTGDLEVRADSEGRTIAGIVVPYDTVAMVSDGGPAYKESFARGSFKRTIQHRGPRVKLLYQHNAREPIGRALTLREDPEGLYGEFRVSNIPDGDHALELVRDGVLDSFSVGFTGIKSEKRNGVVVRTEVALREASLVTFPAYEDARITAVREALAGMSEEERMELLRMYGEATDLSPTTADERTEASATPVEDPAAATPDVPIRYRTLRRLAREKGVL